MRKSGLRRRAREIVRVVLRGKSRARSSRVHRADMGMREGGRKGGRKGQLWCSAFYDLEMPRVSQNRNGSAVEHFTAGCGGRGISCASSVRSRSSGVESEGAIPSLE